MFGPRKANYEDVEFWHNPERTGWLMKQGELGVRRRRRGASLSPRHARTQNKRPPPRRVHQDVAPPLVCAQAGQDLLVQVGRRHARAFLFSFVGLRLCCCRARAAAFGACLCRPPPPPRSLITSSRTHPTHVQDSVPRGVIEVRKCLSIKGAEDAINKPHAFEVSARRERESEGARERERESARGARGARERQQQPADDRLTALHQPLVVVPPSPPRTPQTHRLLPPTHARTHKRQRRPPLKKHAPPKKQPKVSTTDDSMYFVADSDKDKEDWINAVGRAIVKHSRSLLETDAADYTTA